MPRPAWPARPPLRPVAHRSRRARGRPPASRRRRPRGSRSSRLLVARPPRPAAAVSNVSVARLAADRDRVSGAASHGSAVEAVARPAPCARRRGCPCRPGAAPSRSARARWRASSPSAAGRPRRTAGRRGCALRGAGTASSRPSRAPRPAAAVGEHEALLEVLVADGVPGPSPAVCAAKASSSDASTRIAPALGADGARSAAGRSASRPSAASAIGNA